MKRSARLAFALDVADLEAALPLLDAVTPHVDVVKVGLELFAATGPRCVSEVTTRGLEAFLDLKLHDIPERSETRSPSPFAREPPTSRCMRRGAPRCCRPPTATRVPSGCSR